VVDDEDAADLAASDRFGEIPLDLVTVMPGDRDRSGLHAIAQ
jgi:hypothetical protein